MRFDTMTQEETAAYNNAILHACRRAFREHKTFAVYRIEDKFFVRDAKEKLPPMPDLEDGKIVNPVRLICMAERCNEHQVQLRFDGAYSEWVSF